MTDNNPFLVIAVGILMLDHQAGTSVIKVIIKELKLNV